MRRSAAALLARPAAASTPPKVEGVEDVRAAVTATMLAIDSKLAAVRAAVAGGPVAPAAGPPPIFHNPAIAHAAAGAGVAMRRSGSEPELRGWLASLPAGDVATPDPHQSAAAVDAVVAGAMHRVQRRWLRSARLSCPAVVDGSSSAGSGPAPAAAASSTTPPAVHWQARMRCGSGGDGRDRRAEAAPGLWRQVPSGRKPPQATPTAYATDEQDFTGDCGGGAAGDGDVRSGHWRQPATSGSRGGGGGSSSSSSSSWALLADAVPDVCGSKGAKGGLSPRGPGPMLAGLARRGMGWI